MPILANFGELLKIWSLQSPSNNVTRKCQNSKTHKNFLVDFQTLWGITTTDCLKITNNVSLLIHFVKRCKNETFCWIFKQYEKSLLRSIFNLKIKMFTYSYADWLPQTIDIGNRISIKIHSVLANQELIKGSLSQLLEDQVFECQRFISFDEFEHRWTKIDIDVLVPLLPFFAHLGIIIINLIVTFLHLRQSSRCQRKSLLFSLCHDFQFHLEFLNAYSHVW